MSDPRDFHFDDMVVGRFEEAEMPSAAGAIGTCLIVAWVTTRCRHIYERAAVHAAIMRPTIFVLHSMSVIVQSMEFLSFVVLRIHHAPCVSKEWI